MSLEGNLTTFGLSEIFQLIAIQQKSGMLTVRSGDRSKVLFFSEGRVISTRDRRQKMRDPLKDYLTRYGILSREDLLRVMQISTQSKLDLADVIVSERFLTQEELNGHLRNHVQEEIHDLLMWEQCSYKFLPGVDIIEHIRQLGEFSVEAMLMESMRRIDEFPAMRELLPDLGVVIRKERDADEETQLSRNEKSVFGLLSRERSLGYLISRARMPKFDVYEALKQLHDKTLVSFDTSAVLEDTEPKGPGSKKKRRRAVKNVLPWMVAMAAFVGAIGLGTRSTLPLLRSRSVVAADQSASILRNRVEETLRFRLEAFYAINGSYPRSLDALKSAGLATDAFLEQVDALSFRYHLTAGGLRYTLL